MKPVVLIKFPVAVAYRGDGMPYISCPRCLGGSLVDGCRHCELYTDAVAFAAFCAADSEIIDGEWESLERAHELEDVILRYEGIAARVQRDATTPVNGCAHCGALERGHDVRFGGLHGAVTADGNAYVAPSDRLRADRLYARRAVRQHRRWLAEDRLWARPVPPCPTCRIRPMSAKSGECWPCLRASIRIDKQHARSAA